MKYLLLDNAQHKINLPGTGKIVEVLWQQHKVSYELRTLPVTLHQGDILEFEVVNDWSFQLPLEMFLSYGEHRKWKSVICFEIKGKLNEQPFEGEIIGYDTCPSIVTDHRLLKELN